jgi:hypothetical protein
MERTPTPQDFFGENPPQRIIASESECNVQLPLNILIDNYIAPQVLHRAGYSTLQDLTYSNGSFLSNGMRVYIDVGHIEVDTGENLGPRQAAAADAAGMLMLRNIIVASNLPHKGVHRHSGTIIYGKEKTSGYHENFIFPRSIQNSQLFESVMASHLTSRMAAMTGIVGNKFQLSQKVKGIGDPPITRQLERRVQHSSKPMAMIPPVMNDEDTVGNPDWARFEVRFADGGFSLTAQYLGFAATSLVLRMIEHPTKINTNRLKELSFKNPAATAKLFNGDLSFTSKAETMKGSTISGLNYQELLVESARSLSNKIKLPQDEVDAIDLWQRVNDEMRKSDIPHGFYGQLTSLVDFAPRHRYLTMRYKDEDLNSQNAYVTEANLTWDRIVPEGGGMKFWSAIPSDYVTKKEVLHLLYNPPQTRAALRASYTNDEQKNAVGAKWSQVTTKNYTVIPLTDSYAIEL